MCGTYKNILLSLASLTLFCLPGCTEPGETTAMGATTGGVIGAGLGAVVGNQTGDAGAGLVVGAVAGSAAGAAVGNALEAQQETMRTQDEALERQERRILAQGAELEELRRLSEDNVSFSGERRRFKYSETVRDSGVRDFPQGTSSATVNSQNLAQYRPNNPGTIKESTVIASIGAPVESGNKALESQIEYEAEGSPGSKGSFRWDSSSQTESGGAIAPSKSTDLLSDDCLRAEEEAQRAGALPDVADKLFHYRRALRLCPESPEYHSNLGKIYISLNRSQDAEFEFKEALKLNPEYGPAQEGLRSLNR